MPPVNRLRSPSFQEESSDCLSDQDVECGTISHNRYEMRSPLQSKTSTLDLRGAYSPIGAGDDQKILAAHEIVNEEYVKRSTTCTEANSECAICLCAYGKNSLSNFGRVLWCCYFLSMKRLSFTISGSDLTQRVLPTGFLFLLHAIDR